VIQEGQIVIFAFPQTNQPGGKLRPALVLRRCPGTHDDWLICMISSQLRHAIAGTDEVIREVDADFARTGLKLASVVRTARLAVVAADVLQGSIGTIPDERLGCIRQRIADWISGNRPALRSGTTAEAEPEPARP
jgi:mRNA interferase MazF